MTATASQRQPLRADDLATLTELNRNYVRSVAESDVGWFDSNLSTDFLNTNPDGSLVDRAAFLTQIARPAAVRNLACDQVVVRQFGNFAVIHARTTYLKPDGQGGAGRYTDIWSYQDDRWLCIAAHVNRG